MSQDVSPRTPTHWTQPEPAVGPDRSSPAPTPSAHPNAAATVTHPTAPADPNPSLGSIPLASEPWVHLSPYPTGPDQGRNDPDRNPARGSSHTRPTPPHPDPSLADIGDSATHWNVDAGQFSVDAYADRLMNDLFGEVEHILDTGAAPPRAEEQPEFIAIKPLPVRQIQLPPELVSPPEGTGDQQVIEAEVTPVTPRSDRLLQGAVVLSCGMALGLSLVDPDRYVTLTQLLGGDSPQTVAIAPGIDAAAEADQQFIRYLERSLELVEQQQSALAQATNPASQINGSAAALAMAGVAPALGLPGNLPAPNFNGGTGTGTVAPSGTAGTPGAIDNLPTVAVASALPGQTALPPVGLANPNSPTVLDRVYIPVYSNVPGAIPNPTSPGAVPGLTLNPPTAAAPPLAPTAPTALAALPPAPTAATPAGTNPTAVAPLPVAATHTLMGLLELDDRSAALFEINGVTRRIHLGEAIGSSGWTLVEVANQEAIMRRNGEVRSVYVGQAF